MDMIPASNFNPNLISLFKEDELKNLQSCIKHCNFQLKNEQRSWTAMISDNKVIIISLVACSIIIRIAINYALSSSMIVLPFTIAPLLYTTFKLRSLEKEARGTLTKTQIVFMNVLWKYASPTRLEGYSLEEKEQWKKDRQKKAIVTSFIKNFTDSPRIRSSSMTQQVMDAIITEHGDNKGLGSLSKVVFMQMIKDQRRLDKIASYESTCNGGMSLILYAALSIDGLIRPFFFLASKSLDIAFITFTAVFVGGYTVNNYINHRKDQEIGKTIFNKYLPALNKILEIPQELHA